MRQLAQQASRRWLWSLRQWQRTRWLLDWTHPPCEPLQRPDPIKPAQFEQQSGAAVARAQSADGLPATDDVMKALRESTHPQAQFLWAISRDAFHYIAVHLEAIADNARDIDFAMRWGFGQKLGPFETWQASGWQQVAQWVKEDIDAGKALCAAPLPAWVFDGRTGVHAADGSWSPARNANVPRSDLAVYRRQPFRAPVLGEGAATGGTAGTTYFEDDSVRIWHQDDEALVLSLTTTMPPDRK